MTMTTDRIMTLTDGLFAIAMTILVLDLPLPPVSAEPLTLFKDLQGEFLVQFIDYLVAAVLLGSFWIANHKQFNAITNVDNNFLWINIFSLIFISLIPFSISLFSELRNNQASAIFFEINILIVGLIKLWQWRYVTHNLEIIKEHFGSLVQLLSVL